MASFSARSFQNLLGRTVLSPLGERYAELADLIFDVRDDRITFALLTIHHDIEGYAAGAAVTVPWQSVRVDSESHNFVVDPEDINLGALGFSKARRAFAGRPIYPVYFDCPGAELLP